MGFFSGKKSKTKVYVPPYYGESRKWLYDLLNRQAPDMPVQQIPGMTDIEKTGQNLLGKYIGSDMSAGYMTGLDELKRTVEGGYDPLTSKTYQGFREQSQLEEENAVNTLRRRGQLVGMGASTPILNQEGRTRRGYSADRQSLLGKLINIERDRQVGAAPTLMQASDYAGQDPLRKASAAMGMGSLERELETQQEHALFESIMQELMFPYITQANIAGTLGGTGGPMMYTSPGGPSEFEKIMKIGGQMAGLISAVGPMFGPTGPPGAGTPWAGGNAGAGSPGAGLSYGGGMAYA